MEERKPEEAEAREVLVESERARDRTPEGAGHGEDVVGKPPAPL